MKERDERYFQSGEFRMACTKAPVSPGCRTGGGGRSQGEDRRGSKDEDGRTLHNLVSSLVMVIMSGECRTREGLERLI